MVALLLVASTAWGQGLNHNAPSDALVSGVFHVKVSEGAKSAISLSNEGEIAQMGIASIDVLSAQFDAQRIERMFPTDQRHADRHAKWGLDRWYRVHLEDDGESMTREAVSAYHADANVEIADHVLQKQHTGTPSERTERVRALVEGVEAQMDVTNDPLYEDQWHFNNTGQTGGTPGADISLPEAHDIETGSSDVIVQVIDSGIELGHPDMQGSYWINPCEEEDGADTCGNGYVDDIYGYNFADDTANPEIVSPAQEANSHGLHVSGTIAARNNNNEGVASVAGGDGTADSGVRIMTGLTFGSSVSGFAEALIYGADNGAVISNNSWGYTSPGFFEQPVLDAIDYFVAEAGGPDAPIDGGIVVVAAGNSNSDDEWYPAFYEPAFAVAGTQHDDDKYSGSNFGDWVDISAPTGEAFDHPTISTLHTAQGTYGGDIWVGTSMAAPHAAGAAALIASNQPGFTAEQIETRLIATGDETIADEAIGPRVNAFAALSAEETPPDPITDLAVVAPSSVTPGAVVNLQWTATGEAGSEGRATSYDLRYSTAGPINSEQDFDNATRIEGLPAPEEAGTTENFTAEGLPFEEEVYFSIKAIDALGTASGLSNSPSANTGPAPELALTPNEVTETIQVNGTKTTTLNVENAGATGSTLEYSFPGFAAQNVLSQPGVELNNTSSIAGSRSFSKGEDPDAGAGHPVLLGAGGPDEFGYSWIDSNETGGPSFSWTDITDEGTSVTLGDDDSETVSLPFSFEFYGEAKEEVAIGSNGYLTFGSDGTDFSNDEIPNAQDPNDFIAPFWDDLNPAGGGSVHYLADGNRFIVQYTDIPYFGGDGSNTFQVILRSNGGIKYQYLSMTPRQSATVGIEDALGADGLQVAFNTSYVEDELAIDIASTPDFIADVSPASGSLGGGSNEDVTVSLDATAVAPGEYENELALSTNDPGSETTLIPFNITVDAGPPAIAVDPDEVTFDSVIEGGETVSEIGVRNSGGNPLEITSITSDSNNFSVDAETPITIGFDDAPVSIPVTFAPSESGEISGALTIESNADNEPELTVPLSGQGLVAPEIAVDPDAFDVTVDLGETLERTLTVSNTASSEAEDLEYEAVFTRNGQDVAPSSVAAPFTGDASSQVSKSAFSTSGSERSTSPQPFQASDFVYQLDDGSSEDAIGLTNGGDVMWMNAFQVIEGEATIATIASAWGAEGQDGVPEGRPAEFLIYEDPNNDGDPSDAVLLERVDVTVEAPHTDEFTEASISPTPVEGTFFIAALYQDQQGGPNAEFPAPIDQDEPQGASWIVGSTTPNGFDADDLAANELPPSNIDELGFPGNWLLRADAGAQIVAVSPSEGSIPSGGSDDLTVTFDGTSADPGIYEGNISLFSNDFDSSPLDVPVELFIDAGPPQIVLDPRTLEFEDQLVGGTGTQAFEITNLGSDTLVVSSIASTSDDFTATTTSVPELAYAESAEVEVEFTPTETGVRVGTIAIESNAEEKPTAEVAVVGEGFAAPEIAVDPEAFDVTVPFEDTLEETILVSNAGEGELEYEVDIAAGASNLSPAAVAAPFASEMEQMVVDSSIKSARPPGTGLDSPVSYQASEFVYQLDDGSSENALGAGGGEIMWINAFETVEGAATINSIASAWAFSGGEGFPEGGEAEFLLYNDPNNDGNPEDAELLTSVGTTVQAPHTDEFTVEDIAPTQVEGVFFIAAVVGYEDGQFPAPIDESSSQGASWIVGGESVDTGDLSNNDLGPDNLDAIGFPGNWLLRADAIEQTEPGVRPLPADAVTIAPSEGTVPANGEQELAITFNGDIDPGPYNGSIRILNNDPLQSVLDVPVDLLVDAGPPEVALDPESLTFDGTLVGATRTLTFEISNAGGNPLIIESVTSDSGDFTVEEDLAFVVRQDTADVSVTFAPTAVGSRSGAITLQTNIGEDEAVTLPVEGEGLVPPALALSPDVLQNVQQTNTQEDVPLTISNDGESGSTLDYSFPAFAAQNVLSQPGVERNNTSSVVNGTRSFDKGDADPHAGQGHPVQLGAGGPDNFGYRWIDSNEFGGPSFEWVDISENENAVLLDNITDDFLGTPSVEVDLPFEFDFYGEMKTSVRVDNNGFLFFDSPSGNYFINQEIPTPGAPDGVVAPFWTDLNPSAGGEIYVYDDSENGRFIVQYDEVPPFVFGETEDSYTFQIILTAEGMVRYQYLNMDGPTNGATVGVENSDGSDGLQIAFGTDYVENNLAVDIAFVPQFIADVEPVSGSIGSGESESVQVTFDSEGLDTGVYGQEGRFGLGVSTNDPQATFGFVSAILSVVGEDGPQIANAPSDQQLTLGGAPFELDLGDVFTDPLGDGLDIDVEATDPAVVDAELSDNTLTVTPTGAGTSRIEMRASNADGQAQANFVVTVGQLAVDVTRDFGGQAADATNYRLVALPGVISLPMNDIVEGESGLDWQAYWDSGNDGLVQFDGSETFTFEPGRGFWLTGQSAWEYQSEHSAIELDRPDGQVTIPMHEGWNIISNPMGIDLDLVDLEALNGESLQPFWSFNGSFSADSTLVSAMSGEAYYFLNDSGLDELTLQPGEEQPEPPATTAEASPNTDPLIGVSATLVNRPDITSTVQLGVTEASTVVSPLVGPPSDFEAVSLRIQPTGQGMVESGDTMPPLMRAQRTLEGEGETFDLTLRTQSDGAVEIKVSDLMALNGHEAALLHPEAGATYDLRTNEVITIESPRDEATLRVAIGTKAYVDDEVDQVLPTELTLKAYPNPVQSQATVEYTLTEAEDVRFEVYDMLGRRVATLTNERRQAGVHEVQFDANGLASGVYFGRLQVGNQTLTQKITVVR